MSKIQVGPLTWSSLDCSLLQLPVGLAAGSPEGSYDGAIEMSGPGIAPTTLPVHVSIRGAELWAILVLAAAVLLGFLTKWWQSVGSILRTQIDRDERLQRQITVDVGAALAPTGLSRLLESCRQDRDSFKGERLKLDLDLIESRLPLCTRLVQRANDLLGRLGRVQEDARQIERGSAALASLDIAIRNEVSRSWDDLASAMTTLDQLNDVTDLVVTIVTATNPTENMRRQLQLVQNFRWTEALEQSAPDVGAPAPSAPTADGAAVGDAAEGGVEGDVERGGKPPSGLRRLANKLTTILPSSDHPDGVAQTDSPVKTHRLWRPFQRWLLSTGIPTVLFLVTLGGITIYGLQNQYFNKPTFGAGGLGDWITLFAWGFGTGLAGRAINDLIGANPATGTGKGTESNSPPPTP